MATLFPSGRHLVQLSYSRVVSEEAETEICPPTYTSAYSGSLRFSLTTGIVKVDDIDDLRATPQTGKSFSGFADSRLLVQYDPSAKLTANAFVPDTLGITVGVQMPTGDHEKGLSVDAWIGQLGQVG